MVEMRMAEEHLVDDVDAVAMLELQKRGHDAHAAVDERVMDDRPLPPLDERERHVGLPIGVTSPSLVGPRTVHAELEAKGRLNAVRPQQKFGGGRIHFRRLISSRAA